ncbi:MAG: nucleotidyltransferase family protein [Anaerolineae bacterium]|nr:nucleotidyltransferase family protein [Anaerolineae bacterium]
MNQSPAFYTLAALTTGQLAPRDVPAEAWPDVIAQALQHGLGPTLLWITKHIETVPGANSYWDTMIASARQTALYFALMERAQYEINTALSEAGIPVIWLKGIVLAQTVYPQPTLRPMADLDGLVPYDQRETALEVVEALGYTRVREPALVENVDFWEYNYRLQGGVGNAVVVELHYSVDRMLMPELKRLSWFWDHTQPIQSGAFEFLTLRPEAHLIYLCAHAMLQHGGANFRLLHLFDLHTLITHTSLDWDVVAGWAAAVQWSKPAEEALRLAVQLLATPVPDTGFTALRRHRQPDEDTTLTARLWEKDRRMARIGYRLKFMTWAERAAFARTMLFPSPAYVRHRYHLQPNVAVWPYYMYRWFDQARGIVRGGINNLRLRLTNLTGRAL